ncbi:hypothetical protein Tco_1020497 [Tanacetum coccineum]
MFLNVNQLEKQLDKEEFQEIGSMTSFKVLEKQFQMFIKSRMYLDDEFVVMTRNYFLQYTQLAIPEFRDTLIQHMKSVKKSIDERTKHKEEYNSWISDPYKLDEVSYHQLFDILKTIPKRKSHATTRYKGKEIAKPLTPPSESASEEDSDPGTKIPQTPETECGYYTKGGPVLQSLGYSVLTIRNLVILLRNAESQMLKDPRITSKDVVVRFPMQTQELILSHWNRYNTILLIMCLPMTYNILTNLNSSVTHVQLEKRGDSNVHSESPISCDNDIQDDQIDIEGGDEACCTC